jgi:hypothetical protein
MKPLHESRNDNRSLKLRPNPARPHDAPFGNCFEDGKQSRHYQNQSPQGVIPSHYDTGHETHPPNHTTGHATLAIQVGTEETAHKTPDCLTPKYPSPSPKRNKFLIIFRVNNLLNIGGWSESYLWASMIWSTIAMGYLVYGKKQQSMIPFIGGVLMTAVAFLVSPLLMSLICIVIMFGVWWLLRQGY